MQLQGSVRDPILFVGGPPKVGVGVVPEHHLEELEVGLRLKLVLNDFEEVLRALDLHCESHFLEVRDDLVRGGTRHRHSQVIILNLLVVAVPLHAHNAGHCHQPRAR